MALSLTKALSLFIKDGNATKFYDEKSNEYVSKSVKQLSASDKINDDGLVKKLYQAGAKKVLSEGTKTLSLLLSSDETFTSKDIEGLHLKYKKVTTQFKDCKIKKLSLDEYNTNMKQIAGDLVSKLSKFQENTEERLVTQILDLFEDDMDSFKDIDWSSINTLWYHRGEEDDDDEENEDKSSIRLVGGLEQLFKKAKEKGVELNRSKQKIQQDLETLLTVVS